MRQALLEFIAVQSANPNIHAEIAEDDAGQSLIG